MLEVVKEREKGKASDEPIRLSTPAVGDTNIVEPDITIQLKKSPEAPVS